MYGILQQVDDLNHRCLRNEEEVRSMQAQYRGGSTEVDDKDVAKFLKAQLMRMHALVDAIVAEDEFANNDLKKLSAKFANTAPFAHDRSHGHELPKINSMPFLELLSSLQYQYLTMRGLIDVTAPGAPAPAVLQATASPPKIPVAPPASPPKKNPVVPPPPSK